MQFEIGVGVLFDEGLLVVGRGVGLHFGVVHKSKSAGSLCGQPCRVLHAFPLPMCVELIGAGGFGFVALKSGHVRLQSHLVLLEDGDVAGDLDLVVGDLVADGLAGLGDLVAVVDVLDGLLEAYGDEEAENDGGDVDEEIAPGAGGVVWWVDVEHRGGFLRGFGGGIGRSEGWLRRDGDGIGHVEAWRQV